MKGIEFVATTVSLFPSNTGQPGRTNDILQIQCATNIRKVINGWTFFQLTQLLG